MSLSTAARMAPTAPARATGAIRWTRDHLARFEQIGVLPEKYELLDGDIIDKMGQEIPHRRAVSVLFHWLLQAWGPDCVQTQATIDVSPEDNPTNAPEPDLAALNTSLAALTANPAPELIELVIEVAASTLNDDLSKKAELYARAGIAEFWVFDVENQQLHIHRNPVKGMYRSLTVKSGSDEVAPLARPAHTIRPEQILA